MRPRVAPLVTLMALAVLAAAEARAQTSDTSLSKSYWLTAKSRFEQGCFGPCLCPVLTSDAMVGTFLLTPAAGDPLFTVYAVTDINWLVRRGGTDLRITGSGTYRIGGEFALTHQLQLDLTIGGNTVQRFDSGLVAGGSDFPAINLTIAMNGMVCYDTVITVSAEPLPAGQIAPWSVVGSSYLDGCFGPCDCAVTSRPVAGRFGLLKLGDVGGVAGYAVLNINWRIRWDSTSLIVDGLPVTGFGIYEVSPTPGTQRITLDLTVDGKGPQRYDSGWVTGGGNPRRIDVQAAANGFACLDQVFDLHARAIRPVATLPATRPPEFEREPRTRKTSPIGP